MQKTLLEISKLFPSNWEDLDSELKLHHLLVSADSVLKPTKDFILLDAGLTIRDLLHQDEP